MVKVKFFKDFEEYKLGETYLLNDREAARVFDSASCYCVNEFAALERETFKRLMQEV